MRRCSAGSDPLKRYTLTKDFYVGVFEVTQKQWYQVMGNNPSYTYYGNGDTYPVQCVSYNDIRGSSSGANWPSSSSVDASSFVGKLRSKTGLSELDLPTEAQWEYACRAGTTTTYNTGDSESALASAGWYSANSTDWRLKAAERPDLEQGLSEEDKKLFRELKNWRNERAKQEGKPAYAIGRNSLMLDIVKARPGTAAAQKEISGVGEATVDAYGQDILAIVANNPPAEVLKE